MQERLAPALSTSWSAAATWSQEASTCTCNFVLYAWTTLVIKFSLDPYLYCNEKILTPNLDNWQCHKIFCFRFFSWIILPQAPENDIKIISNFFENSQRYLQVKVHLSINDTSMTRGANLLLVSTTPVANFWQISLTPGANFVTGTAGVVYTSGNDGTIPDCWHLKVNLKEKISLR